MNPTRWKYGGELLGSLIYGKLSLLGKVILYCDLHAIAGGGVTLSDAGTHFTQWIGVGQQIYFARWIAFRVGYRAFRFDERVGATERTHWSHTLSLGASFFLP